ncbi:limonene-1,2-epoxide hydrolase family protein [Lentzea sp. BCCO 10_0856]|uniref:Limonene-1,2-epoxide hydrolase family protein n=1 Tax=Lentzea miocenica TaxID=3095431 RepID=A0ABU4T3E1_9PSEU|nr:limonene-1,2-epoxide hydrolase family protein [Lentzea sp. BCCO 10_0856]MDX8032502.1 limonene-1,2-epoxide hydrolase family protein [Lentzea sp. BCCO 10_0856]
MTDPRDVVTALLRATETCDPEEVVRHMADDVVWQNVPLPPARGKATVAKQLRAMHKVVHDVEVRIHNIAANGDVVLTERTDVIGRGAWQAEFWVCGTFVVRDGKVVLWRDYYDNATFIAACLKGLGRAALKTARSRLQPVGR